MKDNKENPVKKQAKLSALKSLRDNMSSMMKDDMVGRMQKVTVAAKDKAGLKEGLKKAEDVVDEAPEMEVPEGAETNEEAPTDAEVSEEAEEKVHETAEEAKLAELEAQIAELKARLKK